MVNFVWKEQGTYIVKYEMSEDDFNNKEWQIGAGDEAFRTYYNGRGYFLQRIWGMFTVAKLSMVFDGACGRAPIIF